MALTPYHCYCCLSHRSGGMLGAVLTLIFSAASAAFYIWVLLDLLTRESDFIVGNYYTAVLVLHYFLIAITGVVFPLLSLVLFAGAYWYYATPVAFFTIMKSFGAIIELGAIVFFAVTFSFETNTDLSHPDNAVILGEIIWFCVRFVYDLHLIFATWSLFQINSSDTPQKSSL